MCLAVPGQIIEIRGSEAVVDFQGNQLPINTLMTPEAQKGDWVLVHAGFSLTVLPEDEARKTWSYLQEMAEAVPDE